MSESIVRKIQPFTIGTKLSAPAGHDYRTLDSCALQRRLTGQVSPGLVRATDTRAPGGDPPDRLGEQEMDRLNRNETPATTNTTTTTAPSSRSIRKITICSGLESRRTAAHISASSENINNNNNIITQLPRIVGVSCENEPHSHFKVLLRKDSDDEQRSSSERTNGFLLNGENRSEIQQTPAFKSRSPKRDLVKGNSPPCSHREISMVSKVLSVQKDCFTQQNALFSKEISQAEAWIQGKLKNLRDGGNMQRCSLADWEEVSQTLQRDLKDFENTLIQLNQMGEQLMCKLNPTSDLVKMQLGQLRDQWSTLKQTAATQTRAMGGAQSLQEFNRKVDQLEMWIKRKEEEQSLASLLGENMDKLQLTRRILDLKQDEQLYRNLHEEINHLALKLEKQAKGEGKSISTRRKHINKMWLKVQSHLKDCRENLQLALEVSSFYQQADNIICSINNMRKGLSVTDRAGESGDGEIRDIASQIMVLDVTVSQLSNLHPALATRVSQKQAEVKDSWLLLQSAIRNEKAVQSHSATREDADLPTSNGEPLKSVGTDPHRIMGKEVKEEQNRLKEITGGQHSDNGRKSPDSQQEPQPNPAESLGYVCASDASSRFQTQGKSGSPPKSSSHPQLHVQLQKFTVSADKTLSWLKDSVTMATHVCSGVGGPGSYEIAKRYQASLEQDILSNKARIELVKKEGHSLVRAQHPGSAKIQEFLSQLEVLWEELKRRHQKNAVVLQASEELNYRAVRVLQALGSLEAWLEAAELSIKQASLAGDPESVSVAERESCLLERELETRSLELHNLKQEVEALCSQRHLRTQLLPTRMEEVEKKFSSVQTALTQQSSELKDTRMLTEFLERVELEESHYGTLGQPLKSDLDCDPSLLPLEGSRRSRPVMESLGDPVEELREAVEMLNDTARERGRSQSHDHSIQELHSRHSTVAAQVEQCLQRCAELTVDVLEMEREMAVRCEPERCGLDGLQEQQDQLETDYEALKEEVKAMESLSTHLAALCPERVRALRSEVQASLLAWEDLSKSMAENRSRLLQFGRLRHFFRNYLAVISWTEDTRSRIFSESALRQGRESQASMVELLDQQIEQKFQEFDLLAAAGKKLLSEDHHLAKMIKERMEELRSMLGWILVHWRAQKDQWLNRKRAEEPHNDAIYSEATVCSLVPQPESETSTEDQQMRTEGSATAPHGGLEDGYEVMKSVSPKSSETRRALEECDSPYLLLKEPSAPSLGGTVNLILSFNNSGDSQLQVQEPDHEKVGELSEAVHRVSTYLHVKDAIQSVAPVYESMTLPPPHGTVHSPASFSPRASWRSSSSSPEVDSTSLEYLPRNSTTIFSSLRRKSKKRKKKKDARRHTVQRIMGVEPSEEASSPPEHEPLTYNMHTWPLKDKKKRKNERRSDRKDPQLMDYVKNPLVKDIDAECLGGLTSPDPCVTVEQSTSGHVKNHCRFLSLGSVLSFDLPKDMSLIPCIQDIITIGPADSRKAASQDQDSHPEHTTALSTFKLARSQPTHKHGDPKPAPPGEISLKIDCQNNQKIHIDAVSVYHNDVPPAPPPAEDVLFEESQTSSLSDPTSIRLHGEASLGWDQMAAHLGSSDHQPPTSIQESPEQNQESISAPNHHQTSSTAEEHICPSVHTLIQDLHGHLYHKAKPTCSQPSRESPGATQSHASHVVLNFKANGREDSVDSGHSSSGSFKLCMEPPYVDTSEYPAPRRTLGKLSSLEVEEPHRNVEPTNSPVDDPVHPDHQQFEQEEEELEDIWNQTNGYRQSICSDIMYQTEPAGSSPDQQRDPSPKEQAVLVRKMITASAPNLLVAEFRLPSSIHNLVGHRKDWSPKEDARILSNGERRSWGAFPQQEQASSEAVVVNETASEPVKIPELKDHQNYIYQYREEEEEEEEEEGDKGGMKDQSMSLLSVHMGLDGDAQVPNHNTGVQTASSPMSSRREFPSMEGTLERKHRLLLGGRRAPCRAWSSYHAVLYRQTLCFYQDRKDTMRSSVTSLPLNLTGAECVPAPEYSKKPNCFSLRLRDGSEYLLSASSRFMMKKWMLRIQANAESSESSEANITTTYGSTAQATFPRGSSSSAGCQCRAACQCSTKGDGHWALQSRSQSVSSARTKEIVVLAGDASHISQWRCGSPEELSPTLTSAAGQCESPGVLLEQRFHSQSPRAPSSSVSPSQDCKRRSHSFTSATYQRIKPCAAPPAGSSQNSGSSYSVTVFIGEGERPSVCSSAVLSQPNSCRQQSISELPLRGYASLPRKSVFRKFFGKKE
ncbi:spectrin beta chain, erythrocytic isoform X2 [Colossoma macropomum]|uniref:spectrin beta chain, erythrocytic isoform X2 n=1 Tax=Colossoma macropomum TaxID=42526 RepID=UPI001863A600|nr:spectrin beta chain, erythrocytic isoform X2 [Colossoma macropomum]